MVDQELLEALRVVVREEVQAQLEPMKQDIKDIKQEQVSIKQEQVAMRQDIEVIRSAVNSLVEWADKVAVITQVRFPVGHN